MNEHRPRKRLGQHFLHDQNIIERILKILNPQQDQKIVEIGPGMGALTIPLLKQHGKLDVVELDQDLIEHLKTQCTGLGSLNIHSSDALKFDFCQFGTDIRIIGNLPYNISTPLIFHLLDHSHCMSDMLFMLQKEIVERLAAVPGCKAYGRLTIMVQSQCYVEKQFTIGPGAFSPAPKIDSSIVTLKPYDSPVFDISNRKIFSTIVKQAFAHRRKTLRNTLKDLLTGEQIESLSINPSARAEELTIKQFTDLANLYHGYKKQ